MNGTIRFLLFFLTIAWPLFLSARETKKLSRLIAYPGITETYYVLKSDTNIKHGSYRLESMGKLLEKGFYRMGKMDSLWMRYNLEGTLRSRGWYKNNQRDSIWEYFSNKGELEQKIDFTNDVLLLYKTPYSKYQFHVYSDNKKIITQLDRPPLYVGGSSRFTDFLADEITMPLHKSDEKAAGTVFIGFTIDSTGVASNFHLLKGIGKACNEEALRAIQAIPNDWMPGVLNGKFVTVEYVVTVVFDEKIRPFDLSPQSQGTIPNKKLKSKKNDSSNMESPVVTWSFEEVRF